MNETFNIQGIILKRDDFRETDGRVLVYSQEKGLMELIARGTKKAKSKLAAHLEPMSLVEIMIIRGKNYDYVGSALARDCFRNLKEDYNKIMSTGAVLRRVGEVVKAHEVDENIFFLLVDFLSSLNSVKAVEKDECSTTQKDYGFFIFKLMSLLGYQPILNTCLGCGQIDQSKKLYFNAKKGGLECEHCVSALPEERKYNILVSIEAVILLRKILENSFANILKLEIEERVQVEIDLVIKFFEKYHLN
ncbi:DNA repair protein RecO [Candidatus Parcubacteria bacterium]|nr:DNA repair protein RecO [Patescibacteria group bacterium]MBU4309374.1 DNA repair protein RecO [Patescibacteria group bacterium]MBU4432097.1 DNA repair protein RecO [Patescibacteria group bacterium]MBU4577735.1 DNA repair protein RecO [Patescibacteria group bacterium]MCG2697420.1 DNA repair protein RecO [Candidatus Parcubacteria bacterium]